MPRWEILREDKAHPASPDMDEPAGWKERNSGVSNLGPTPLFTSGDLGEGTQVLLRTACPSPSLPLPLQPQDSSHCSSMPGSVLPQGLCTAWGVLGP
jgi:hypothetical protein